jgi:hypothetical protein
VAREVIARDPLAARLSAAERRRRLLQNIAHLENRWSTCAPGASLPPALTELRTAARSVARGRDTEALEADLTTLDLLRQQIEPFCGERVAADHAIEIIAALHGVASS